MAQDKNEKEENHIPEIPIEFDPEKIEKHSSTLKGHLNETIPKPRFIPKPPKLNIGVKTVTFEVENNSEKILETWGGTFQAKNYSEMNLTELKVEKENLERKLRKIEIEIKKRN